MRKRIIFLGLLVGTSFLGARTLSVDDLVEFALKHSPDIQLGNYDLQSARQKSRSVRSVQLPQMGLSIQAQREFDAVHDAPDTTTDTLEGTLSVTQLLYDFGRSAEELNSAREDEKAADAKLRQLIADKIFQVKQRYYEALKAKTMIRVHEENVRLQRRQLYRAQKYLKSGIKTAVDVTDAKLGLQRAEKTLSDARYLYMMNRALLEESLGNIPEGGRYRLYTRAESPEKWQLPTKSLSLEGLLSYARKHRPILEGIDRQIRSADALARSKALHTLPKLELYAESGAKATHPSSGAWNHEKVGVRMNWSLFSGYRESAEAQMARIESMKVRAYREQALLSLRKEVTQAYLNLKHLRKQFALNRAITLRALEKFHQAKKRYANDLADYLELQSARQDYIGSLGELVNSYFDYYIALAYLDHAVGR